MTCPIYLHNTGNVALQSITLTQPTAAVQCTTGLLLPGSPPAACNVTVTANHDDFDSGFMQVLAAGFAVPRVVTPSIPWQGNGTVRLVRVGQMTAAGVVKSGVVTSAGERDGLSVLYLE